MRGIWVGPSFAPRTIDVWDDSEPPNLDRIAVDVEREGIAAFGIDLLYLTPQIVRDVAILDVAVWSVWPYDQSSSSGRRDARNATDIALTLHQPTGSAIYFPDPPEDAEPDYWQNIAKALDARGFTLGYHGLMPPRSAAYVWSTMVRSNIVTGPRHPLGILCGIHRAAGLWAAGGVVKPRRRSIFLRRPDTLPTG